MEKMLLKPSEAAEILGIGRTRTYEMLASGELPSIRMGRSIRVPVAALKRWVEERQGVQSAGREAGRQPDEENSDDPIRHR